MRDRKHRLSGSVLTFAQAVARSDTRRSSSTSTSQVSYCNLPRDVADPLPIILEEEP
jgi:hypothetical protein